AIVNITWAAEPPLELKSLLSEVIADFAAQSNITVSDTAELQRLLEDFFLQRIRTLLQDEQGIDYDLVNAVLGEDDPAYAERVLVDVRDGSDRARFLQTIRQDKRLDKIYETVNRASRLAAQGDLTVQVLEPEGVINPNRFEQPSEQRVYQAIQTLVPQTQAAQAERDYSKLVAALAEAAPAISAFFDGPESVMVMADNPDVRANRLNLLGLLRNHARVLADFGAIVK
ncbi:MAG: DALR anticodon-binding domain-containing protein, partial [Cyanobacteria bacterium P01_C01_bin.73]